MAGGHLFSRSTVVPGGLHGVDRASQSQWTRPSDWRVHAYHPEGWGNWGFSVDDYVGGEVRFGAGGNQEARGGGVRMGDRYFAGMVEELYVFFGCSFTSFTSAVVPALPTLTTGLPCGLGLISPPTRPPRHPHPNLTSLPAPPLRARTSCAISS